MKTKRYFKSVVLTLVVTGMCLPAFAAGVKENPRTQASYSNAAEAEQAASVAKRDANSTDPSLQAALANLNEAEAQMGKVTKSDNQRQMMSSKAALDNAEHQYAGMLSKTTGVSEKEIGDMHKAGVSWSDVATELGVQARSGEMAKDGQKKTGSGHLADADAKGETHQGKVGSGHLADADAKGETHQGKVGSGHLADADAKGETHQGKVGSGHLADADAKGETHQGKVGSGHLADVDAKGETHQGKVGSGHLADADAKGETHPG